MRDGRAAALQRVIADRIGEDAILRKAYADLRETCAFVVDPRRSERDLARSIVRFLDGDRRWTPVSARFEAVLDRLSIASDDGPIQGPTFAEGYEPLVFEGVRALLRKYLGRDLDEIQVLDPWAGEGRIVRNFSCRGVFANEADPRRYADLFRAIGNGAVLADSFRLPERVPTPGFDFTDDENVSRIDDEQARAFSLIVTDLRQASPPDGRAQRRTKETWGGGIAAVRWMTDRLAPAGLIAFFSDTEFVDDPKLAEFRAGLAGEFGVIAHLALPAGIGLTFLVRGAEERSILYAKPEASVDFESIDWQSLEPTPDHVWRREILSEGWGDMMPVALERGAIFREASIGVPEGIDTLIASPKARRILRQPFVAAWRNFARRERATVPPADHPTIVVLTEPFGVLASNLPVDRRLGGASGSRLAFGGRVNVDALRRFRAAYGAAVTEQDVFEASLALLHHPDYGLRYHEDLRRSVARLALPDEKSFTALLRRDDAPLVGPGTAFRTGWLDAELFEPGTLADFDDPFASPFARDDIDPGFLLLVGLGSALVRVQADFEKLIPFPLERSGEPSPIDRMRLSKDRKTLAIGESLILAEIPSASFEQRIGRLSAPEWVVDGLRARPDFDPNLPNDPERPARLFAQAVQASLEIRRLVAILGEIPG